MSCSEFQETITRRTTPLFSPITLAQFTIRIVYRRASVPQARQPLTPPPPSSTGLRINNSDISASSSKLHVTNQSSLVSNNGSIFASVNKSLSRRIEQPELQYSSLKYAPSSTVASTVEKPAVDHPPVDHRHSTTVTAAATAAATDRLQVRIEEKRKSAVITIQTILTNDRKPRRNSHRSS